MSVKYFVISLQDQEARRKNIGSILTANNVDFEFFAGSTHLFFRRNYINIVCMENLNNLLF